MSRIALDLRMLVEPPDGVSRYALELLRRLPAQLAGHELVAVGDPSAVRRHVHDASALRALSRLPSAAEQLELPYLLRRHRVDLLHATQFSAPALGRRPYVLTLHDAAYLSLPELYGRRLRLYFQTAVRLFAARAAAVVTVSEFSRLELERHLGLPTDRVEVIPNGIDERFHPASPEAVAKVRERLGLPREYLLYVGRFVPHKNVPLLLRAMARNRDFPALVLCGHHPETIRPEIDRLALRGRVIAVPGQGDDALPALYSGALAFVFPSRYEGFGLPPLEAMACGTPTIVADAASLPEVTGGAALTFPPDDEAALSDQLRRVLGSKDLREQLSMRGLVRAAHYRWDTCAARLAGVYRRVLGR